jgi:hypothetical protein
MQAVSMDIVSTSALTELLEGFDFSDFSMARLIKRVEHLRERPILVLPVTIDDPHLHGAWIGTMDYDCICLDRNTALVHQDHILCHEIGHMILGHSTLYLPIEIGRYVEARSAEEFRQTLEYALSQETVLKRGGRDSDEERQAEEFATALQNELIRRVGLHALTRKVASSPLWSEMARGLGLDR